MTQPGQPGSEGSGGYPPAPQGPPPPPQWQSTPQPPQPPQPGGYPPQQPGYPPQQPGGYPPQQPGYPPQQPGGYPPQQPGYPPQQPGAYPPPPPQPGAPQMPAWTANLMSTVPVAGPAGFYYGDVPNRSIAFIIDYIIYFIAYFIIGAITISIFGTNLGFVRFESLTSVLVQQILAIALAGAYFIYTWVYMRGTIGMRVLGMQIGHEQDGRNIDLNAAAIRFAMMFGPGFIAGLLYSFSLSLGFLTSLVSLIWFIALLVTTAQSPTKQGLHDRYAHTMVVKAARAIG